MNLEDSELERHWAALRELAEPAPAERQRVLDAVRTAIELETSGASGGGLEAQPALPHPSHSVPKPRGAAARSGRLSLRPWIGGALIGAAVGLGLGLGLRRTDTESETMPPPSLPSTVSGSVLDGAPPTEPNRLDTRVQPTLPDETTPTSAPNIRVLRTSNRHASRPATQRRPSLRASDDDFEQQLALLQRAESALHASNPQLALGYLSDLDRRAARASLREERLTALTLASCAVGQVDAARTARRELLAEFPNSIYLQRLADSCARDGASGPGADAK